LWTTPVGSTFTFHGAHYDLEGSPALPKPVQHPHPPVVIGGGGASVTPRLAARFATEYNAPFLSPEDAARQYGRIDRACESIGRDPATIVRSFAVTTCCGSDAADADRRASDAGWKPEDLRRIGACGTPGEVVERLGQWGELGATAAYLQLPDPRDLDHIELLGSQLLPQL
jgi:alkanesulfonate monooxygenase SsuD/methylene tetrahydromethanopterin reductase-like flavin-dependent oxidoreductase (luciferase family)